MSRCAILFRLVLPALLLAAGCAAEKPKTAPAPVKAAWALGPAAIAPGSTFWCGIELEMEPGWHVYWLNPGESGLPTRLTWSWPAGFRPGPPRWPLPLRFTQPGGIEGFGYEKELLLAAPIEAPGDLIPGSAVKGRVEVAWLACKEACIPGKVSLTRSFAVADAAATMVLPPSVQDSRPLAAPEDALPFQHRLEGTLGGRQTLVLTWSSPAPAGVEWFPPADPAVSIEDIETGSVSGQTRIVFQTRLLAGQQASEHPLESIVAWTGPDGRRRGALVPIHWRKA